MPPLQNNMQGLPQIVVSPVQSKIFSNFLKKFYFYTLSFFYKQQFISNKLETGQLFRKNKQLTGHFLKNCSNKMTKPEICLT